MNCNSVRKLHIQQNYDKCVNAVATDPVNSNKWVTQNEGYMKCIVPSAFKSFRYSSKIKSKAN